MLRLPSSVLLLSTGLGWCGRGARRGRVLHRHTGAGSTTSQPPGPRLPAWLSTPFCLLWSRRHLPRMSATQSMGRLPRSPHAACMLSCFGLLLWTALWTESRGTLSTVVTNLAHTHLNLARLRFLGFGQIYR